VIGSCSQEEITVDQHVFDHFTRAVARPGSTRRGLLRGALALGATALIGGRARAALAGQEKMPLCHVTGDPANPYEVITVAGPSWDTHFAHGDKPYAGCCLDADCATGETCGDDGACAPTGACTVDADCEAVDPCTPATCVDGSCQTTSACTDGLQCLQKRDCANFTCADQPDDFCGIMPCPRIGDYACQDPDLSDVSEQISCWENPGCDPI
jgi:hypothetical protein